jgi:hypothetical protein
MISMTAEVCQKTETGIEILEQHLDEETGGVEVAMGMKSGAEIVEGLQDRGGGEEHHGGLAGRALESSGAELKLDRDLWQFRGPNFRQPVGLAGFNRRRREAVGLSSICADGCLWADMDGEVAGATSHRLTAARTSSAVIELEREAPLTPMVDAAVKLVHSPSF